MARSLAAGLVHNWSLPYAPYLVVIISFDACLDRDFIDRSRYCGATTVWQSIFGGTGRVHIQGKGASHFARLLLNAKDLLLHSDPQPPQSPVLSESPPDTGSDLPGQAGSSLSCIVAFVISILVVCLRFGVGTFFAPLRCFMGSFGSHFPRIVAAPFLRICFWGLLSLCSSLCVYGFRHVLGGCCASLASRVFDRFRISNFPRLGATIAITLVLWQISFLGIRVGEASNPGPTMSSSVPVSDGVTTPLPQFQDRDLEISFPGLASHPPGSLPVTAPSLSLAPVAHPYVSVLPPPQSLFVRPSRFCSFSRPGSAARRSPSQARTAPHRRPFPSSGFHFLCVRSVFMSSSFPHPLQAFLSGPLLSRPC